MNESEFKKRVFNSKHAGLVALKYIFIPIDLICIFLVLCSFFMIFMTSSGYIHSFQWSFLPFIFLPIGLIGIVISVVIDYVHKKIFKAEYQNYLAELQNNTN